MAESLNKKAQRAILKAIETIANKCEEQPTSASSIQERAEAVNNLSQAFSNIKGARDIFEKENNQSGQEGA